MLLESDKGGIGCPPEDFEGICLYVHTKYLIHAVHSWGEFCALPIDRKQLLEFRTLSTHVDHGHVLSFDILQRIWLASFLL